ncbi:glycosyltransferase [Candidatus Methylopumilus planktonicus]|mgnify:CR=1 FL=1|jgi:glycosyltransferase involved in cell wall biosynthesis|uniref:glycosyltransferase n=1 Tax=Candidatus Methylopumilus planktonicus TaxID=1581557 RepID=UPI003BEF3F9A
MKVSGFTFIRNGSSLGYPFIESIKSILPICDEFIVAIGRSEDDTLKKILALRSKKIKIIETLWNENISDRGFVYAQQKMIAQYNCTGDWAFYLEGDEIVDSKDHKKLLSDLRYYLNNKDVEALAFHYHHFYGSPDWLAFSPRWYRKECRIIRNTLRSWDPDSLYFLVMDKNKRGRYPRAKVLDIPIYHYGHVRKTIYMSKKVNQVGKFWGHKHPKFKEYSIDPKSLKKFNGKHPLIIKDWLKHFAEKNYIPDVHYRPSLRDLRHRIMMKIESFFKLDLTKKHFKVIR